MFDFLTLKKSVAALGSKVHQAQDQLETMRRRREEIAASPTSREDAIQALQDHVDHLAASYRKTLADNLAPLIAKGDPARVVGPILSATRPGTAATSQTLEAGICLAFGPQLKTAIAETLAGMDWPAGALDAASKTRQLAELDEAIERAERELSELVQAAQAAGVSI